MTKSRNILAPRKPWSMAELELLRANYPDTRTADLAAALGRRVTTVSAKANSLGITKSAAFLRSEASGRIQHQSDAAKANHFKPGIVPWNKGSHYTAGGRSAETRFQPGQKPHTWVPVGSLRVNGDGYLDLKVNDLPGERHVRWRPVHRLVWEKEHGPTPPGHVVVFKPGRHSTDPELITPDAVELITRQELMRRNTVHRLPKELVELVQLRGALNRQINARSKKP